MTLLIDFGLVVLIWAVQLIIYPSFTFYSEKDLLRWHSLYTQRISILVIPLMFIQLGLHGWQAITQFNILNSISMILVIGCWVDTFLRAAPLHGKISRATNVSEDAKRLVRVNWLRTILWSLVFIVQLASERNL